MPLMRVIYLALAAALTLYLALCAAMFAMQRSFIYHPQPRMVRAPGSTLMLDAGGIRLVVTVRPQPGPKALLYFGGNGEDVSQSLQSFSRAFPDYALYLLHYRGYGGSGGTPSESALLADALALFARVHAEHPEVAVIGRSLGSGIAVHLASEVPVSHLVLVTPYDSIEAIAAQQYPYLPVRWLLLDRYESWRYASVVRVPTTLIVAQDDEVIPRANTERLLSRFAPGLASMKVIAGVGHTDIGEADQYLSLLQAALR